MYRPFYQWVHKHTYAYYKKNNTYKGLPRRWEMLTSFCNGYSGVGQHRFWHGIIAMLRWRWIVR